MYKKGRVNSNSRIISTDEDPSLRIESYAIINLRGVSTKLSKYKLENTTMATKMASQLVEPMPPFDPDAEIAVNVAPRWHILLEDFQMHLVAEGITDKKN